MPGLWSAPASLYRRRQRGADPAPPRPRAPSHRALGEAERGQVLDLLHSERFVDQAPIRVCAALLDEDRYLCSVRTMYRILDANSVVVRIGTEMEFDGCVPTFKKRQESDGSSRIKGTEQIREIHAKGSA